MSIVFIIIVGCGVVAIFAGRVGREDDHDHL